MKTLGRYYRLTKSDVYEKQNRRTMQRGGAGIAGAIYDVPSEFNAEPTSYKSGKYVFPSVQPESASALLF